MAQRKAYLAGAGMGNLASAVFMVRDANIDPKNITIFEVLGSPGGSCDAAGSPEDGYIMRGGRMLNLPTMECLWGLMDSIPSIDDPSKSLYKETKDFNSKIHTCANARLVTHDRKKVDVTTMGFDNRDRIEMLRLIYADEQKMGDVKINEWFQESFFHTNFWLMWSSTFAFEPWHSAAELARYMRRFMHEFPRIHTLAGVHRTIYNQYDSIVLPTRKWLEERGVNFVYNACVVDLDIRVDGQKKTVTSLKVIQDGHEKTVRVAPQDIVIVQNGSMTDDSSVGDMDTPAVIRPPEERTSFRIWEKLAKISPDFGNPEPFTRCVAESLWQSFTVTINDDTSFFDQYIAFSGNQPGTGALMTFRDSNWLMSIVVPKQPHFRGQPENTQVFWGYALFPDRVGNFVSKPMTECTGREILQELIGHLRFDPATVQNAICKPCIMPYITSMFMARHLEDRPTPVPKGCTNLGFVSQFVDIPNDVVFTVEYSIRAAQTAVYQLLGVKDKKVPKVTRYDHQIATQIRSVKKAFQGSPVATVAKTTFRTLLAAGVAFAGYLAYGYFTSH